MPAWWADAPAFVAAFVALHAFAAALLVRQALGAGIGWRQLGIGALAAVGWVLACLGLRDRIPAWSITILQEGFAGDLLERLVGGGLHGLPGQAVLVSLLSPGGSLRDVVVVDLAVSGVLVVVVTIAVARLAGHLSAALFLVVPWLVTPVFLSTALSTEAAPLASLYPVLAVLPVTGRWGLPGSVRVGLLVVLTALAATVRREIAVALGLATLVVLAAELAPVTLARAESRWQAAVDRLAARPLVGVPITAMVIGWATVAALLEPLTSRTIPRSPAGIDLVARAVHPLNAAWATAPLLLIAVLPVGLVGLAFLGWLRALRDPVRTGGVALSLPIVWQAWHGAAHGWIFRPRGTLAVGELFRYVAQATPLLVVLAAWGIAGVVTWARRSPSDRTRTLWALCLLPGVVPVIPSAVDLLSQHKPTDDPRVAALPLHGLAEGALQRQARATLAAVDANPTCALLTRTRLWGSSPEAPVVQDVALVPGTRGRALVRAAPGALPALDAPCTLILVPLDCGLAGGQVACDDLVPPDAVRLSSSTFATAPWVYADHTGGWSGPTQTFELWRSPASAVDPIAPEPP